MMRFEHIGYGDEGEREQKADESEQFSYFRIPRLLVRSKKFKTP